MSEISQNHIIKSLEHIKDLQHNKSVIEFIQNIIIQNDTIYFSLEYNEQDLKNNFAHKEKLITACEKQLKSDFKSFKFKISLTSNQTHKKVTEKKRIHGVKKVILIASGKGGVGKSMLSANLALAFAHTGKKTAIADVDIYGPSIPQMFDVFDRPVLQNNLMKPHVKNGIKLISMGFLVDQNRAAIWRGPMITKALHQLLHMTNWTFDGHEVDALIIDTPPGTGDIILSMCEHYSIDQVILISTPQIVALNDVRKAYDMFIKLNVKIAGIVENMSYMDINGNKSYIFGKGHVESFAHCNSIPFLGQVPIDPDIAHNCDHGLSTSIPQKEVFDSIAQKLSS